MPPKEDRDEQTAEEKYWLGMDTVGQIHVKAAFCLIVFVEGRTGPRKSERRPIQSSKERL